MLVLLSEMQANRDELRVEIYKGLRKNTSEYTLLQAILDLDLYYRAGTIPGALMAIAAATGKTTEDARETAKAFRDTAPSGLPESAIKYKNEGVEVKIMKKPDGKHSVIMKFTD